MDTRIAMMGSLREHPISFESGLNEATALRNLIVGRKAEDMRQLKTPEEQQAFANNTFFSRDLNKVIRADQAAAAKAVNDQLVFNANLAKTYGEIGKIGAESGKLGAETGKLTTETGITRQNNTGTIWSAFLTGGAPAAKSQLENAKANGVISPEAYQSELQALTDLTGKDAATQQQYAMGRFKGMQDPKYMLTTADNVLDNNTSVDNNKRDNTTSAANSQRTYDASVYGTNKQFELGTKKLTFEEQEAKRKSLEGKVEEFADGAYTVYPDGTADPLLDKQGNHIKSKPNGSGAMSATAQKELFETTDSISAATNGIANLKDALNYSKIAYDGVGASQRAKAMGQFSNSEAATATTMLDNIVTGNALEMLKATFGGAPTEGERAILLQLQGSANLPRAQREAIYTRAIQMAERRMQSNQAKAEGIRSGSYFQSQSQSGNGSAASGTSLSYFK